MNFGDTTTRFNVRMGETNTINGKDGQDGQPGSPGKDGISPTVAVEDITGGHRVTITDANGQNVFDVEDGKPGKDAPPYTLPAASADTLGGVMVGDGLVMNGGVLGVKQGMYELISVIDIEEPVARVMIDGFLLKEMLMTVYVPISDSNNVLAANIYTENSNGLYFSVSNAQSNSGGRYTKVFCVVDSGLMRLQTGMPAAKELDCSNSGALGFACVDGFINGVSPYMGSSKDFPVGSWIKLEGVRA